MVKFILFLIFAGSFLSILSAQKSDAKDFVISGNQNYMEGNFAKAEAQYKSALNKDANSIKANYNLGNSLYKQKRFDEAIAHYNKVIQNPNSSQSEKAKAYHNIGKSYLDENDTEKAVANFKESLKLNPYDDETRYNYALARKLLEKQQKDKEKNQDKQNQDNSDKSDSEKEKGENDKNEGKEQNQNGQNSENKDKNTKNNQGGQQQGGENGNQKGQGNQPQQQDITKGSDGKGTASPNATNNEYQNGVLDALKKQEQETLKRIISQKAQKVRTNTEKDW